MEDLFSDYRASTTTKKKKKNLDLMSEGIFISPEMFIGGVIIFIISLVLSFSIGVEQGKRITMVDLKLTENKPIRVVSKKEKRKKVETSSARKPISAVREKKEAKKRVAKNTPQSPLKGRYAVQLVVYKDVKYAKKELEYLTRQKYPFFQEKKNGKIIISAGPFSTKQEAETAMKALRKRYKDCFVKLIKK